MKLKSLNCSFLTASDINRLALVNVHTTEQLIAYADLDALSRASSLSVNSLKLIKKFIIGQLSPFPESGEQLLDKYLKRFFIIEFGCKQIDELVLGGIYSSQITEITGSSATGKTQLCFNLIVNMFKAHNSFNCIYIDSNHNFCLKRVLQLFEHANLVPLEKYLKSIQVVNCLNAFHLNDILYSLRKSSSLTSQASSEYLACPNLLIIDNVTCLFNLFKTNNIETNFYLNYTTNALKYLATNMNMAIVCVTNRNYYELSFSLLNNIFNANPSWSTVCSLQILLENVCNGRKTVKYNDNQNEEEDEISVTNENENDENSFCTREINDCNSSIRKFQVTRCTRPDLPVKRVCLFSINQIGIV